MTSDNEHSDDNTKYASDSSDSVVVILNPNAASPDPAPAPAPAPAPPVVATWLKPGAACRDKTPPRFRNANINGKHGFNRHRNW